METLQEMRARHKRESKRANRKMLAVIVIYFAVVLAAVYVVSRAIEAEGGLGKVVGGFLRDVQVGPEPTDD